MGGILRRTIQSSIVVCLALILLHCQSLEDSSDVKGRIIAEVNGYDLYLSDIPKLNEVGSEKDSIQWIKTFAERWSKDKVMLLSAERHIQDNSDVEELVDNYRNTLMLHRYEKNLIESQIDSTVSQQELLAYYQENKSQYILESSIVQCLFVKLGKPIKNIERFKDWWESDDAVDRQKLIEYCQSYANIFLLEDSSWYRSETIAQYLPAELARLPADKWPDKLETEDDSFHYFLRVLNTLPSKEIAPLTFIEEQARRVILHKRKLELLEDAKNRLYENALRENQVKIHIE